MKQVLALADRRPTFHLVFLCRSSYSRDHRVEGGPFAGADRHNGEIAAFHVGRLLGLNRTPLVAGRKFNITELEAKSTPALKNTFYKNGGNEESVNCDMHTFSLDTVLFAVFDSSRLTINSTGDESCFYGKCHYCKRENGVCASSGVLEGAVVLMLPEKYPLQLHRSPWQRTYRKGVLAK